MSTKSSQDANSTVCDWCGQITSIIWVHGHGQCSKCGTNIDECCRGENQQNCNQQQKNRFHR